MAKKRSKMPKRSAAKKASALPKGFRRRKSISAPDAHMLAATTAASMGPPPYVCIPTGPPPSPCLRYGRDPNTGQYSIPPMGELMDCAACRGGGS